MSEDLRRRQPGTGQEVSEGERMREDAFEIAELIGSRQLPHDPDVESLLQRARKYQHPFAVREMTAHVGEAMARRFLGLSEATISPDNVMELAETASDFTKIIRRIPEIKSAMAPKR